MLNFEVIKDREGEQALCRSPTHSAREGIMYVLCTLVVLTLQSLFKSCCKALESKHSPEAELETRGQASGPEPKDVPLPPRDGLSGGDGICRRTVMNRLELSNCRLESQLGISGHLHKVPDRRNPLQVRRSGEGRVMWVFSMEFNTNGRMPSL